MAEPDAERDGEDATVPLGEIQSARSRHMRTRSAVHATDNAVLVGQWNGTVTAVDADSLEPRWTAAHPDHAVGIATFGSDADRSDGTVVVAGRGETGSIAAYDLATGERRWRYDTVDDVGEAVAESVFSLPYVVALAADDEHDRRLYAAARRYERDGDQRRWQSTVLAFDADGTVRWRYETDASPIALDLRADGDRLAVGYNRCAGAHDNGLVVLETATGELAWTWDPGTEGDRRVGDVSFDGETVAVASHGDKRGYLLGSGGGERWRVDLATETEIGDERLYAYPNHAYANDGRAAFVTGNTYAREGRETEHRHPNEHRIVAVEDGDLLWDADVRGFVHELAADGDVLVAPSAQNFRVRDPATHAVRRFDLADGPVDVDHLEGVATAATIDDGTVAAIEEPVTYHDEGTTRGAYTLHVEPVGSRE